MQLKCADFMQTSSFHRKPNQHSRVNFQLGLHFCMCAMRICMRRGARINKRRETKQPPPSTPICRAKETLRRCVRDLSRGARFAYGNKSEREECLSERCHGAAGPRLARFNCCERVCIPSSSRSLLPRERRDS